MLAKGWGRRVVLYVRICIVQEVGDGGEAGRVGVGMGLFICECVNGYVCVCAGVCL